MNDAEIAGKLSRIFETHTFQRGDANWDLEDLLEDLENEDYSTPYSPQRPFHTLHSPDKSGVGGIGLHSTSPTGRTPSRQL
jgi:hypothetical protein